MKYWNATWSWASGCTPVSPGCDHCWSRELFERFHRGCDFGSVKVYPGKITQLRRWRKPRVVFCSTFDPFHKDIAECYIREAAEEVRQNPRHQVLWLTKRSKRMLEIMSKIKPVPNLWLGVTTENQKMANERIPDLVATPAAHRWVSVEPMLGPVDLFDVDGEISQAMARDNPMTTLYPSYCVDWVVVGGESGSKARPCNVEWIRYIVQQCEAASVACLVKQIGSYPTMLPYAPGQWVKDRSGANPLEWPTDLRVQQFPEGLQP